MWCSTSLLRTPSLVKVCVASHLSTIILVGEFNIEALNYDLTLRYSKPAFAKLRDAAIILDHLFIVSDSGNLSAINVTDGTIVVNLRICPRIFDAENTCWTVRKHPFRNDLIAVGSIRKRINVIRVKYCDNASIELDSVCIVKLNSDKPIWDLAYLQDFSDNQSILAVGCDLDVLLYEIDEQDELRVLPRHRIPLGGPAIGLTCLPLLRTNPLFLVFHYDCIIMYDLHFGSEKRIFEEKFKLKLPKWQTYGNEHFRQGDNPIISSWHFLDDQYSKLIIGLESGDLFHVVINLAEMTLDIKTLGSTNPCRSIASFKYQQSKDCLILPGDYSSGMIVVMEWDNMKLKTLKIIRNMSPLTDFLSTSRKFLICSGAGKHGLISSLQFGMESDKLFDFNDSESDFASCCGIYPAFTNDLKIIAFSFPYETRFLEFNEYDHSLEDVSISKDFIQNARTIYFEFISENILLQVTEELIYILNLAQNNVFAKIELISKIMNVFTREINGAVYIVLNMAFRVLIYMWDGQSLREFIVVDSLSEISSVELNMQFLFISTYSSELQIWEINLLQRLAVLKQVIDLQSLSQNNADLGILESVLVISNFILLGYREGILIQLELISHSDLIVNTEEPISIRRISWSSIKLISLNQGKCAILSKDSLILVEQWKSSSLRFEKIVGADFLFASNFTGLAGCETSLLGLDVLGRLQAFSIDKNNTIPSFCGNFTSKCTRIGMSPRKILETDGLHQIVFACNANLGDESSSGLFFGDEHKIMEFPLNLNSNEQIHCINYIEMFKHESCAFFLIGTSILSENGTSTGRMILGIVSKNHNEKFFSSLSRNRNVYVKLLHAAKLPGSVLSVTEFDIANRMVLATAGRMIYVLQIDQNDYSIKAVCKTSSRHEIIRISVKDNFIVAVDQYDGIQLYSFGIDPENTSKFKLSLKKVYKNSTLSTGITFAEIIDQNYLISGDRHSRIQVFDEQSSKDTEAYVLEPSMLCALNEKISKIKRIENSKNFFVSTLPGSLYLFLNLKEEVFGILKNLESKLIGSAEYMKNHFLGVGDFESYWSLGRKNQRGHVDLDLLFRFLDLSFEEQKVFASQMEHKQAVRIISELCTDVQLEFMKF